MTPAELRQVTGERRALGHEWVQLVIRRANVPKDWDRTFVIPGLYGRCVGEITPSPDQRRRFLIDVRLDDVERRLRTSTTGYDLQTVVPAPVPSPGDGESR